MTVRASYPRLGWRFWLGVAIAALGAWILGGDLVIDQRGSKQEQGR